jgi:hypothetical protein
MIRSRRCHVLALLMAAMLVGCTESRPADLANSGHWLWSVELEDEAVVRSITDADMVTAVGPSGWPGCPDGIICTRWGIQKLSLSEDGRVHLIHNVFTSSDFHLKGSYAVDGDLYTFTFQERFSCAHPDQVDQETRVRYARWKVVDGDLHLSVAAFDSSDSFATTPPESPTRWLALRPVTAEAFENRYMIRLCQAATPDGCHPDCFPERFGSGF